MKEATTVLVAQVGFNRDQVEHILRCWVSDPERLHTFPTRIPVERPNPVPMLSDTITVDIDHAGNAVLSYRTDGTNPSRAIPEQFPTLTDIKNMEAVLRECRAYLQGSYREMPTGKTTMVLIDKIDMIVPRGE